MSTTNNKLSDSYVRAVGNQIYLMNFEKNINKLIYEFPYGTIIHGYLAQLDSETIMFNLQDEEVTVTLNIKTKKLEKIGYILNPVYMKKYKRVVYFGKDRDGKGALLHSDKSLKNTKFITESKSFDPTTLIRISDEEVVFQKNESVQGNDAQKQTWLWRFNIKSNTLTKLHLMNNCYLYNVWRSKNNQLFCRKKTQNRFDYVYFFINLSDLSTEYFDYRKYLNIGGYNDELDAFIIQKEGVGGKNSIWVYNIRDNTSYSILNNASFAPDTFKKIDFPKNLLN